MTTRAIPALLALLALAACDDEGPAGPSVDDVAGVYEAVEIRFVDEDVDRNLLQEGAFIDLTLHDDGVSEGDVYIPALTGGAPLTGDLDGAWEIDGTTIRLAGVSATFLRDVPFAWDDDGLLRARFFTAEGRLDITLSRGEPIAVGSDR
ncbi:MAG TPA: hypothetical protein VF039_06395 [Longimicrobiales bacterium]